MLVGLGKLGQIMAKVIKGGQVWMGQADQVGACDMANGWVLGVPAGLGVGVVG